MPLSLYAFAVFRIHLLCSSWDRLTFTRLLSFYRLFEGTDNRTVVGSSL